MYHDPSTADDMMKDKFLERHPSAIWLESFDVRFYLAHFLGFSFGDLAIPEGSFKALDNAYRSSFVMAQILGGKQQGSFPHLYVEEDPIKSPAQQYVRQWLEGNHIEADPKKRQRPLILLVATGEHHVKINGRDVIKGFNSLAKLGQLIREIFEKTNGNVDILLQPTRYFSSEDYNRLKYNLSEMIGPYGSHHYDTNRVKLLPWIDAQGKSEWMKYFIYVADAVLSVEGGNIHSAVAYGTPVVSIVSTPIINVHGGIKVWEPEFAGADKYQRVNIQGVYDEMTYDEMSLAVEKLSKILSSKYANTAMVGNPYDIVKVNSRAEAGKTEPNKGIKSNSAMIVHQNRYGGINLNPELLALQIKRDKNGIALPISQQPIASMKIDGFIPIIISLKPINLSLILTAAS